MILNAIRKGIFDLIFSPWVLLPLIAVALFGVLLTGVTGGAIEKPIVDLILYYDALDQSNLLYVFLTQYPVEVLTIILTGFVGLVVSAMGLLSLARIAKGEGFMDAVNNAVGDWKKGVSLGVFFFAALIVVAGVLFVLSALTNIVATAIPDISFILGFILFPLIFLVFGVILLVKLSFIIPALVKNNLKKALQKSWSFTDSRFWGAFLLIIALMVIGFIISIIAQNINLATGTQYELVILSAGDIISATLFGLSISHYYFSANE